MFWLWILWMNDTGIKHAWRPQSHLTWNWIPIVYCVAQHWDFYSDTTPFSNKSKRFFFTNVVYLWFLRSVFVRAAFAVYLNPLQLSLKPPFPFRALLWGTTVSLGICDFVSFPVWTLETCFELVCSIKEGHKGSGRTDFRGWWNYVCFVFSVWLTKCALSSC